MIEVPVTFLIVPGLREHVPLHWQTLLAAKLARVCTVPPLEHNRLSCAARVQAIDVQLRQIDGPVVIVAHSAGVIMVAHWAAQAARPINGALLAAPADLEAPLPEGYPKLDELQAHGWLPIPRKPLPFRSIVAASTNDPLARFERVAGLADAWGSRLENIGAAGHLNPNAGYGEWPQALSLLAELTGEEQKMT